MPYVIDPRATRGLADEVRRVARSQLKGARAVLEKGDVYESRKSLKRVRALLRLVRPAAPKLYKRENAALREVGRALSPVRDADAAVEAVDALLADHPDEDALRAARGWAVARRDAIRVDADAALAEARAATEDALGRVDEWAIPDRGFKRLIAPGLERSYAAGRALMPGARKRPTQLRLHEFRKRVKDHRDHTRLLAPLWPEMMEARQLQVTALSRALGLDRDLAGLDALLEGAGLEGAGLEGAGLEGEVLEGEVLRAARTRLFEKRALLAEQIWPLARRVYIEAPADLARRMRRLARSR